MKIAAIVVLYHPEKNLIENILSYYDYVDKIYVFDNTEEPTAGLGLSNISKIIYHHSGENNGISKRLNEGCAKAIDAGYEWVMTMDQDSSFSKETAEIYFSCFLSFKQKEITAQFGIKHSPKEKKSFGCEWNISDDLITSATLLNLSLYKKIGVFDENFFIDSIDHDYCIRAILAGYQNVLFSNIFLKHEMGTKVYRASIKSFFILKKYKEVYSPLRCYYKLRNVLYLEEKFKSYNLSSVVRIKKDVYRQIKECIFYGRNTFKIFRYLKKAKTDFRLKKWEKFSDDFLK